MDPYYIICFIDFKIHFFISFICTLRISQNDFFGDNTVFIAVSLEHFFEVVQIFQKNHL